MPAYEYLTFGVKCCIINIVEITPQSINERNNIMKNNEKNEVAVTAETTTPAVKVSYDAMVDILQGELGLSPLAVGEKFESDDLVQSADITLWAYDWVNYIENEGTDKEREVRFALWKTTLTDRKGVTREGYYQGGAILNKLATAIGANGLENEMAEYGVKITAKWGKTSSKNDILLIQVVK